MKKDKYRIDLEIMRIFAIIFVIFNHINYKGYQLYALCEPSHLNYWIYLGISIFCKFSVPLFFAISGVLLIGKKEDKKTYSRRIIRILVVLILFSLLYSIYDSVVFKYDFSITSFLKLFYSKGTMFHLWYLYAYIAFLIALPFLRKFVEGMKNDKKLYNKLILVALIFMSIIPTFEWLFFKGSITINSSLKPGWILNNIFIYPVIGYYIDNYVKLTKKKVIYLCLANVICILIASFLTYYGYILYGNQLQETFHNTFSIINLICVFSTIKYFGNKIKVNNILKSIIISLGSCTFGIYLLHPFIRHFVLTYNNVESIHAITHNYMIGAFIITFIIFIICYIIIFIMKHIPIIKKFL